MLVLNKYEGPRAPSESGVSRLRAWIHPDVSQLESEDLGKANLPMWGSGSSEFEHSDNLCFLYPLAAGLAANQEVLVLHT